MREEGGRRQYKNLRQREMEEVSNFSGITKI
jgi:hypothetical protein